MRRRDRPMFSQNSYAALFFLLLPFVSCLVVPDPLLHFSIGALAGGTGAVAAYPFDYIKAQMQTELGKTKYKNGLDVLSHTLSTDPLLLYKGVGIQIMGVSPKNGIRLGVNDVIRGGFMGYCGYFPLWGEVVAGCLAGACQVITASPLEVIKVALQTSEMTQVSQVMKEIGGIKGLFRGAEACILRDVVFAGVCFPLYQHTNTILPTFVAGAIAGMAGAFVATPPDFIKTRILSQDPCVKDRMKAIAECGLPYEGDNDYLNDRNPFVVAQKIARTEGLAVFFSGVNERVLGSIPRFGTTLAMHDFLEHCMQAQGWIQ